MVSWSRYVGKDLEDLLGQDPETAIRKHQEWWALMDRVYELLVKIVMELIWDDYSSVDPMKVWKDVSLYFGNATN